MSLRIPEKRFHVQKGMLQVCIALAPCTLMSVYLFGWRALAVLVVTVACGMATEALFVFPEGKPVTSAALVTCMILALSLPPTIPFWICSIGVVVGIGLGKMAFGGFGRNIFNPAMVGRCFIYVAFPIHMTNRWVEPLTEGVAGFAAWTVPADALTRATPLAVLKSGESLPLTELLAGTTSGSLGESSALLIVLGGLYLVFRKVAPWRIALSCLAGGFAVSGVLAALDGQLFPAAPELLLSGSFLFGAAFVATEPISGAKTAEGQWVYGFMIGALTVVLRRYSNFSEGIMFSVLLMNGTVPLLDRAVRSLKGRPSLKLKEGAR